MKRHLCPSEMAVQSKSVSLQILSIFLILLSHSHPSTCITPETQALLEFKSNLIDPLNHLQSWNDSANAPCNFNGVTCDRESGLVTEIVLDAKNLSGVISPLVFSRLRNLTFLSMPSNQLSGILPMDLIECKNLKVLNFSDNYMNGTIPDLSGLTSLESLDLSDNYLSGAFPSWLGNLTNLVSLGLGNNNFDEGEIPENLGNLKELNWLYLTSCSFKGQIPESVFELEALGTLDFCKNMISGDFPVSITKLKNLWKIELYTNNFTGQIPDGIANLTLLQEFDISDNQMSGKIPEGIGNLKNLTVFHLFKNNFSGEIPRGFGDMEHLIDFSVYKNSFTGEFPENLGRFSPLNTIDISENKFSGPFPKYLCQNGNLQFLLALDNDFSGEFSDSYSSCTVLQRLRISQNHLEGKIPDGVWSLPNVQVMDFADNSFTGSILPRIGKSLQLTELMLSNNRFSGELPKELGNLTKLERIYMNNNSFSGIIPSELGGLKQLSSLHLEDNELIGSIPSELADCQRLVEIDISSNSLTGDIPESLAKMVSLNSLNLSTNQISGEIPRNLNRLKLSFLDLSNNQLTGSVSPYLLTVAGDNAFRGNKGLCLDPEDERAKRLVSSGLGLCNVESSHKGFVKSKRLMLIFILLVLTIIIGGVALMSYKSFKWGQVQKNPGDEKGLHYKIESFQQVQLDADEICSLDEDNLIGSGSTGKVYRLDLKKGCGTVAVKQLWRGDGVKLMAAEIEILGKIRHRNIVKLYASLIKGGSNFLVFEYMANGNLFQALHREIKAGQPELDWHQRYKIGLCAAKGLAYLHHDCSPAIIHRDIKSTNILLDQDYEAKIADFGVAKVADQISPGGSEASCFAGTHGYMAPELAYSLKVTEKSDVYSFGVVLLELVTGRKPVEDEYGEGKDIVYWVSVRLSINDRENLAQVLDPKVVSELVREDMTKVLKIATLCTSKLPNLRPGMKEVVKMLVDAEPYASRSLSPVGYQKNEKPFI